MWTFNEAADRVVATGDATTWPLSLRVKSVKGTHGVFEMTWRFSGPDGRATWEWVRVADQESGAVLVIRWRRIGGHGVFGDA